MGETRIQAVCGILAGLGWGTDMGVSRGCHEARPGRDPEDTVGLSSPHQQAPRG